MQKTVHIIGAGLSGLSAAVRLANAGYRGARPRGDAAGRRPLPFLFRRAPPTSSSTTATICCCRAIVTRCAYARSIGTEAGLVGPQARAVSVRRSRDRQALDSSISATAALPLWMFDEARRVPDTRLARLSAAGAADLGRRPTQLVGDAIPCEGTLYERLVQPLLLAALNVDPPRRLGGARRRDRARNAAGGRPGLPAADRARRSQRGAGRARDRAAAASKGGSVHLGHELRELDHGERPRRRHSISATDSDRARRRTMPSSLAVPPRAAAALLPGLTDADRVPRHRQRAFPLSIRRRTAADDSASSAALIEWLFAFPQRLSVTISNADRLVDVPREELAQAIWRDVCKAAGHRRRDLPPWQIVRERRATFAATPEQNALRPGRDDGVEKPVSRRRLDRYGLAGDHRRLDPVRRPRRRSRAGKRRLIVRLTADAMIDATMDTTRAACRRDRSPGALEAQHRIGDARRCWRTSSPTATGCSSSKPTPPFPPNTCCCGTISASRSMPSWKRKIGIYLRRIQGAHGGWPLFHDGAFDMSASVKAYFALKMIGDDIDAPHMARAREAILLARRRRQRQRVHALPAGAVRRA